MRVNPLVLSGDHLSRLGFGCANLVAWGGIQPRGNTREIELLMRTALDHGITLFDHADVYAFGRAEEAFGSVLRQNPKLRDTMTIQTKCGQLLPPNWRHGDPIGIALDSAHILSAVESSLRRLATDRIDILLLHAPSAFMEPEEIASAFDRLHDSGMVRYFGVSNFNSSQIALLQATVRQDIVVSQIPIGLNRPDLVAHGQSFAASLATGANVELGVNDDTLEYCRAARIRLQAWSPLRGISARSGAQDRAGSVHFAIKKLAERYGVAPPVIALAWLLSHPANIVPIVGTTHSEHIAMNVRALEVRLDPNDWYELLVTAVAAQRKKSPEAHLPQNHGT
jgi:predicted oxidoreductase